MEDGRAGMLPKLFEEMLDLTMWIYSNTESPDFTDSIQKKGREKLETLGIDEYADSGHAPRTKCGLLMQASSLACRIFLRTISSTSKFSHDDNNRDMKALYEHLRLGSLKAWTGLPYIYLWW